MVAARIRASVDLARSASRLGTAILLLAALLGPMAPGGAHAQDRRSHHQPGLILNTGARHATCDVLLFSPDGANLLAVGDDKVVRIWGVDRDRFRSHVSRTLRWPIYREQRGGIFALALSPDASRLVIGGYGLKTGFLAVLNRATGAIENALEDPPTSEVTWAVAYAPTGRYVVYGTETGELFRWDLGARAKTSVRFNTVPGRPVNRVRRIVFLDNTRFLSVAQDGVIREWDVTNPKKAPRKLGEFKLPRLLRVAISKDRRHLAASGEGNNDGADTRQVELINLAKLRSAQPGDRQYILVPQRKGQDRYPRELAFDEAGERLAVGGWVSPDPGDAPAFARITGGWVHVYTVADRKRLTSDAGLDLGYRAEAVAFRPGHKNQLATAGGDNHEIRLWDITREKAPLDEIRGPGSCLWGVAMSRNNRYLAWKEHRSSFPQTPTEWGAGPWRILDLRKHRIVSGSPSDFVPVAPLKSLDGWEVLTTTNGFVWKVIGPGNTDVTLDDASNLYQSAFNQIPRCYTFLPAKKGKPVRLAVGHSWGVSLYELEPGKVRWVRSMLGHESEVMAVAPTANGELLLTASRDQTLAAWSLEDWPLERELGARFTETEDRKILVAREGVVAGSPAWEAGLTDGDQLAMVVSRDADSKEGFLYDPQNRGLKKYGFVMEVRERCTNEGILKKLQSIQPGREYIFVWTHKGKEQAKLTTVRQRPLWRFFPTHSKYGNDWVIWRWRDFYYDTSSPQADRLVGWQVNPAKLTEKPAFYPLEYFRGTDRQPGAKKGERTGFNRPEKVWPFIARAFQAPDKVLFPDIEPPDVQVKVVQLPAKNTDLALSVLIKPRNKNPKQELRRVTLWLDDYRYNKPPEINKQGEVRAARLVIPRASLRRGVNRITVQAYNAQGGRGQDHVVVDFDDGTLLQRNLFAVCVGINHYKVKEFGNLRCSVPDALEMSRILRQQEKSRLYRDSKVALIEEKDATAANIRKKLREVGSQAKPNDWFILFLSGHGAATRSATGQYDPGSFFYVCADTTDLRKLESMLTSRQLYDILSGIRCRKLIILDTCHSGDVASNPVRDLTREGMPFLIFSSCEGAQVSYEPFAGKGNHGLFTECLLEVLEQAAAARNKKRTRLVTARELEEAVRTKLPLRLKALKVKEEDWQTPVFLPRVQPLLPVLCKP